LKICVIIKEKWEGMEEMQQPKIFLIGDPHFGHRNIIHYCNRPFDSVEQMNEALIKNWNSVVGKQDIVYVLGDFALCGKDRIIEITQRLNGRKRLVLGNHDGASLVTYHMAGFEYVYNHSIILDDFYILSHYPQTYIQKNGLYGNIYAHVHDDPAYVNVSSRTFCVSVERETMNYMPIEFEKVKQLMRECEENGK
jgi:calcineurin-like phosphoesterase family protein